MVQKSRREYFAQWRVKNREKVNGYARKWREQFPGRHRCRVDAARGLAFIRSLNTCFAMDTATMMRAAAFEDAYDEYERWFASLDASDS